MQNSHRIQFLIALLLILGQGFFCFGQSKIYAIDSLNSQINFSIKHLGVLNVDGQFHNFTGSLIYKENNLQEVNCAINVKSIDTNDKKRDESLLSESYLNAKTFPSISFRSTEINANSIIGILKIKKVEKKITIPFQYKMVNDKKVSGLAISTTINRKDFKLDFGAMNTLVGNEIKIKIKLKELFKK